MAMFARNLKCTGCDATFALTKGIVLCPKCAKVLDIEYDLENVLREFRKEDLWKGPRSIWRYQEFLPIAERDCIVSMGEGLTPMVKAGNYGNLIGLSDLHLKLDYLNPTGSFKDRGTSVAVSKLRELGVSAAFDDSSGNAGASLAAYCAAAKIACTLYVPAEAPREKLLQSEMYGAQIIKIKGTRSQVEVAARDAWRSSGIFYASHNLSPFFFEGMKTLAYEIAEELSWQVPDHVVFPVGGGALLAGAWKGYNELAQLGWIDRVPKLHCIQSESCMPIVEAFRKGSRTVKARVEGETVAGGIRISNPGRGEQVLQALHSTRGAAAAVSDDEILTHQKQLARKEGIFAEPTSCAAIVGLTKLLEMEIIHGDELVVVPLTGFGLKDSRTATASLERNR